MKHSEKTYSNQCKLFDGHKNKRLMNYLLKLITLAKKFKLSNRKHHLILG